MVPLRSGLLQTASVLNEAKLVVRARRLVIKLDGLYDIDEQRYFKAVDRDTTYEMTDELIQKFEKKIMSVARLNEQDYAQRVFHDRQLCEHVVRPYCDRIRRPRRLGGPA